MISVVNELENGTVESIAEARRKYGIPGADTVVKWLRKYGRKNQVPRVLRVERPGEKDQIKKLKQENERLKRALADEHLKAVLYESWLEVACEEFGVQDVEAFKKKLEKKR